MNKPFIYINFYDYYIYFGIFKKCLRLEHFKYLRKTLTNKNSI